MSTDRRVVSLLDGTALELAGRRAPDREPRAVGRPVATASLGDAETFVDACRRAKAAQPAWADVPAPVRGRAIQHLGRLVEETSRPSRR